MTKLDYVEWIYALHVILNLNGGKVTLQTLFDVFNPILGMDVKHYNQYFRSIKIRKKGDQTFLLDLEKQLLVQRIEK